MTCSRACLIVALVGSFAALAAPPVTAQTSVIDIGTLPGASPYQSSALRGVNDRNEAVGWCEISGSDTDHAILWRDGQLIDLGVPPGSTASTATAINDRGQIVGLGLDYLTFRAHAVRWDEGLPTELAIPGAHSCYASDIDNRGRVVGSCDAIPLLWSADGEALRLALPAGFASGSAGSINDAGVIAGAVARADSRSLPARWRDGVPALLPLPAGATSGAATAINGRGDIVGYVRTAIGSEPVLWTEDRVIPLAGRWGAFIGEAWDINARGEVTVLGSASPEQGFGDFVWRDGTLHPLAGVGYGVAINNRGVVVGQIGSEDGTVHGAVWPKALTRVAPGDPGARPRP